MPIRRCGTARLNDGKFWGLRCGNNTAITYRHDGSAFDHPAFDVCLPLSAANLLAALAVICWCGTAYLSSGIMDGENGSKQEHGDRLQVVHGVSEPRWCNA